jgi:HlyD family secretion protein
MKVEEGQVLARLDDSNVRVSLHVAESELAASQAARGETRVLRDEAEKELRRVAQLAARAFSTTSELDHAQAAFDSLQARLALQEAQAVVAEKQVAAWQQQIEDTVIRAPFAGIAVSKNAQSGEMISPISAGGGFTRTGIGTIVDMGSLEIEVDVNESYLIRVQAGQPVEAALDAYPEWKIPCKVLAIIPTADRQKSTVKVRVKFDALDPRILPDMGVKVAFQGRPEDAVATAAVVIPEAALRRESGRSTALAVEDGRVRVRALTVDGTQAGQVSVTAGLKAGERVIVEGPAKLEDGRRVREAKP